MPVAEAQVSGWDVALGLDFPLEISTRWVKNLRHFFEDSQESFADKLDVSTNTVTRWEMQATAPSFEQIVRLLAQDLAMVSKSDGDPAFSLLGWIVRALATNELPKVVEALKKQVAFAEKCVQPQMELTA